MIHLIFLRQPYLPCLLPCRSNCCIRKTGNSWMPQTGDMDEVNRRRGTNRSRHIGVGRPRRKSRRSGVSLNMLLISMYFFYYQLDRLWDRIIHEFPGRLAPQGCMRLSPNKHGQRELTGAQSSDPILLLYFKYLSRMSRTCALSFSSKKTFLSKWKHNHSFLLQRKISRRHRHCPLKNCGVFTLLKLYSVVHRLMKNSSKWKHCRFYVGRTKPVRLMRLWPNQVLG